MVLETYDCDLAPELVLDLARLDGIRSFIFDDLVQVWSPLVPCVDSVFRDHMTYF